MNQDLEHLRLLSIFHYVMAGLSALMGCVPIIHMGIGLMIVFSPDTMSGGRGAAGPPPAFGWFFIFFSGAMILFGWTLAVCSFLSARSLTRRTRYMFCIVVAGVQCLLMPVGTVLGVFTIIVLNRPSVKARFAVQSSKSNVQSGG